ncbi:subtilisin-like protein [Suhomyces tanzawaensis NRRL Y-17324]|uniref:Subtilisin-like protein n=1 Tax=Suhomyces tanzawaensis NRRL Y-17324 TaxID=984487 RepID=A0A1E4SFE5_9ASCO|nr:subtilisin-like protein [Suhomyces tanzawaensis NRRL Y-17324]ODV78180.1 subtilisin-like protein [Suhomyces tanzawaensis NRRL Y-17324]
MKFGLLFIATMLTTVLAELGYLVSLKPSESLESFLKSDIQYPEGQQVKAQIKNSFSIGTFRGFSGNFSQAMVERLRNCPLVSQVSEDIAVNAVAVQEQAPRHLVRLSQRQKLESDDHSYIFQGNGAGVLVYVVDTGVAAEHPEFEGRVSFGADITGEGRGDPNGHGTHVAGIVGSKSYGVSKNVEIVEVKALNKNGAAFASTLIEALEFVVQHRLRTGKPGVVNLSLGAGKHPVLEDAVKAAAATGLVLVAAAGNANTNACNISPANSPEAITVGAIDDLYDTMTAFTNWGSCVDLFASGMFVPSINVNDDNYPLYLSGTSMSAPIVAGLAANLLSEGIPPKDIKRKILDLSTRGGIPWPTLFFKWGTPNRIAYNGAENFEDYMQTAA